MRKLFLPLLAGVLMVLLGSCAQQPAAPPAPEFRPTATIKDIMDSLVDPGSDYIWDSVATTVSAAGIDEKRPQTDDDWKEVRRHAIMVMEATNMLLVPGRRVAKEGEKSENPDVELGPEQIADLIAKDPKSFVTHAHNLYDTIVPVLKAVDTKDAEALLDSGDAIDKACENCHLQYWYPEEAKRLKLEEQQKAEQPK